MTAYYNEIDQFAAQWLRELIKAGAIAQGEVDERSIIDVEPADLRGFTQCHFFAGIGTWSYALRLAGWADERPVWTGSPPCQPFSVAGARRGVEDERHLAPHFLELVAAVRPPVVFGEQVAAAVKKDDWLDDLLYALEREDYATGAAVLPACGVGAPHIRQRLWFVAERLGHAEQQRTRRNARASTEAKRGPFMRTECDSAGSPGAICRLADNPRIGSGTGLCDRKPPQQRRTEPADSIRIDGLADAAGGRVWDGEEQPGREHGFQPEDGSGLWQGDSRPQPGSAAGLGTRPSNGFWDAADWIFCRDGRWRPVESGTSPLVNGAAARVGRLRGYGNGIVAQAAAEVILAYMADHYSDEEEG